MATCNMDSGNAKPGHPADGTGPRSWRTKLHTDLRTEEATTVWLSTSAIGIVGGMGEYGPHVGHQSQTRTDFSVGTGVSACDSTLSVMAGVVAARRQDFGPHSRFGPPRECRNARVGRRAEILI